MGNFADNLRQEVNDKLSMQNKIEIKEGVSIDEAANSIMSVAKELLRRGAVNTQKKLFFEEKYIKLHLSYKFNFSENVNGYSISFEFAGRNDHPALFFSSNDLINEIKDSEYYMKPDLVIIESSDKHAYTNFYKKLSLLCKSDGITFSTGKDKIGNTYIGVDGFMFKVIV